MTTYHDCTCGDYIEGCITCSIKEEREKWDKELLEKIEKFDDNHLKNNHWIYIPDLKELLTAHRGNDDSI